MKVMNCETALWHEVADEFATSNEVWPDEALDLCSTSSGDSAVVIGSGNAPNILPMVAGIERVSFFDISPGHGKVFEAKLAAASAKGGLAHNVGAAMAGAMVAEANLFDFLRSSSEALHILHNATNMRRFSKMQGKLRIKDVVGNILDDSKARIVNEGSEKVGWVHLSNVVPYCVERNAKDVERRLFGFIDDLDGIDDETIVTFSNRSDIQKDDLRIRRLLVVAKKLDDLVFSDLLNDDQIDVDPTGAVVVKKIA